jgi:hypothetical protein
MPAGTSSILYISVPMTGRLCAGNLRGAGRALYITRPGHHALGETDIGPQGRLGLA